MQSPNRVKSESELKLAILRGYATQAKQPEGSFTPLLYDDRRAVELMEEMLFEGLISGRRDGGLFLITGIRDAGFKWMAGQTPIGKVKARLRRVGFLLWTAFVFACGYVLGLDSVRSYFSEAIKRLLK